MRPSPDPGGDPLDAERRTPGGDCGREKHSAKTRCGFMCHGTGRATVSVRASPAACGGGEESVRSELAKSIAKVLDQAVLFADLTRRDENPATAGFSAH